MEPQTPQSQPPKKSRPRWIIIAAGVLVVLCLCVAIAGSLGGGDKDSSGTATQPTAQPVIAEKGQVGEQPADTAVPASPTDTPAPKPTKTPRPTNTPEPSPTPNVGKVGERREAGGIALTVMGVSQAATINDFMKAADGNTYLILDVLVENTGKEEAPYNPLYFTIKDTDGFQYQNSIIAPDPTLQSGTLPIGDKARGNVAFEVKDGAKGLVVTYEPLVILGGYEPIRIAVEQ